MPSRRDRLRAAAERTIRGRYPACSLRTDLAAERLAAWAGERPVRLLDAGCDVGMLSMELARRFPRWTIEAVDVNDEMLAMGRRWAAEEGLDRIEFRHADLTRDLPAETYDVVAALECLSVIGDLEAAIAGMAGSLVPGGLFAAHVPAADWEPVLPGSPGRWDGELRHGFRPDELGELLDRHGLRLTWTEGTQRTVVQAAQEISDKVAESSTKVRLAAHPALAAAVRLERLGLGLGTARGLYVEAIKR